MAALPPNLLQRFRRDPRLQKLPPYLSALCIIVGIVWVLLLPLNRNSRQTYISENALLPGQVHTYFGGSEQNIYRAYKQELEYVSGQPYAEASERIQSIFRANGLKTATQDFRYESAGEVYTGENVYSIIHAPRGDGTEAIVLIAAWKNMNGESNLNGVSLALTLARYFSRWSLWSKDIIILVTPESMAGPQAWIDAYHDTQKPNVGSLSLKSGALQGAVAIDLPLNHRFSNLHMSYDGTNGQLPNLDLINTAVSIASGQMGISTSVQHMYDHHDSYKERLETMLRGMARQATGYATGPHSVFMSYHVDAITLTAVGDGWQDEMAFGRTVESVFRSLNNLLEHFHQSFFFYLLMQTNRFVSIGTYLPSAMLLAANFTIMAIALWIRGGQPSAAAAKPATADKDVKAGVDAEMVENETVSNKVSAEEPSPSQLESARRDILFPSALVILVHVFGMVPLYTLTHTPIEHLRAVYLGLEILTIGIPALLAAIMSSYLARNTVVLTKSISLLLLGLFLSALATLNFSLSLAVGLICSPLTFIPTRRSRALLPISALLHLLTCPTIVLRLLLYITARSSGAQIPILDPWISTPLVEHLVNAAFAWNVWGTWVLGVVICGVWWPAWVAGGVILWSSSGVFVKRDYLGR